MALCRFGEVCWRPRGGARGGVSKRIKEQTVEIAVPRERVQQCTAEQFEDAPQNPEETVEAVTFVPRVSEVVAGGV